MSVKKFTITEIGKGVFLGCKSLTSITIPNDGDVIAWMELPEVFEEFK